MTNTPAIKIQKQSYNNPISFQDLTRNGNIKEKTLFLTGIYNGYGNGYIWTTSGYLQGRQDSGQIGLLDKLKRDTFSTSLVLTEKIKKIINNGANNLRCTRTKYLRFPSQITNTYNRQSLNATGTKIAVILTGTGIFGVHILNTADLSIATRLQASSSILSCLYLNNADEVFFVDVSNVGQFRDATTGAVLGSVGTLSNTVAMAQDATYIYVISATDIRRINKATRALDGLLFNHGISNANKIELAFNRLWIAGTSDVRGLDLSVARGLPMLLPIMPSVMSGGQGSWILPTASRLFIVSNLNYCQIRQVNLATNQLHPENTEIRPNINYAFLRDNKIYIGYSNTLVVYNAIPNALNTLDYLYTVNFNNTGQIDQNANISNFFYPVCFGDYMYFHDTTSMNKFNCNGVVTINGLPEQRQTFEIAPTNQLDIEYSGNDLHDLYPNISMIIELE